MASLQDHSSQELYDIVMGTTGYSKDFLERFRFWEKYNTAPPRPPAKTKAAIQASYNATFRIPPGQAAPPTVTVPHPVAAAPNRARAIPKPRRMPLRDRRRYQHPKAFYQSKCRPRGAPQGGSQNWRPVKYLGQASSGDTVVLWEYNGPIAAPPIRKIAVKNKAEPGDDWLRYEGQFMVRLNATNSEHIVRLLVPPRRLTGADLITEGGSKTLDVAWLGMVRRLIMEFCPQGSLQRLLTERRRRRLPFAELTLWRIFQCIVDGLAVLEYDDELVPNPAAPGRYMANPATYNPHSDLIVHFDLKPDNILGVDDRMAPGGRHPDTQTWKIADFGLAQNIARLGHNTPTGTGWQGPVPGTYLENDRVLRAVGTEGYLCPEQFSPRWNYVDYRTSTLCAKFGRKTNIWGVGQIMYELTCLDQSTPEPYYPFNPAALTPPHTPFNIHNNAAKGITYGTHLRATPYSKRLKDTIHECLYEEPAHRPDLETLKTIIDFGISNCILAGQQPEGWHALDSPEPRTGGMAKQHPSPTVQCTRTITAAPGSTRCTNTVKVDPENPRPRCAEHYNLIKFPWQ